MAEALAVVGLASNVVQFLDAAGNFLSLAHGLYKSGSFSENDEIEKRTFALQSTLEKVHKGSKVRTDPRIKVLVSDCSSLSHEMTEILAKLKLDKSKNRFLQVSSKSLRTVKKKEKIRDMERRLEKMRNEICSHLMVFISNNEDDLTVSIRDLMGLNKAFQNDNAQRFHRLDVLIQNLKDMLDRRDWENGNHAAFGRFSSVLSDFNEKILESKKIVRILKSLHFSQIKERRSDIREAHQKTMEWIFNSSCSANFVPWLSSSDASASIYWVMGKAGSGKSTLMKFIEEHENTRHYLAKAAPDQQLIIATHYFWCAGTSLQRSQIGLFRTLLFQILSQCPELILDIVPSRWADDSFASLESWSRAELLAAFKRLAEFDQRRHKLKICFFIDGLDEYDGDHQELAKLFRVLSQSPHLKLCLSSRPWQDFIDAFGNSKWTVRVQDLTKDDIRAYIKDNLEEDPRFQQLRRRDQHGADELAWQIQERAHGVFLWVYLVVRSLLRGLVNSDHTADLHRRLNDLPTELEKYFELMLETIEPFYQRQTAQVFRVMLASVHSLPVITFHFIAEEQKIPGYACSDVQPLLKRNLTTITDQQQRQLNASCRDLLYISVDSGKPLFSATKANFLHRSVVDFLRTSQMDLLLTSRSGANFNPNSSLCRANWAMFRAHLDAIHNRSGRDLLAGTLYYAREVERQSEFAEIEVINAMSIKIPDWAWVMLTEDKAKCLLDVATQFGMKLIVTKYLEQLDHSMQSEGDRQRVLAEQLRHSLRVSISVEGGDSFGFNRHESVDLSMDLSMLQLLLKLGANPNAKLSKVMRIRNIYGEDAQEYYSRLEQQHPEYDRSIWSDYLFELQNDYGFDPKRYKHSLKLEQAAEACKLMISYGAQRYYQKLPRSLLVSGRSTFFAGDGYLRADDVFTRLFPGKAKDMIHALNKKEGQQGLEADAEAQSTDGRCLVM